MHSFARTVRSKARVLDDAAGGRDTAWHERGVRVNTLKFRTCMHASAMVRVPVVACGQKNGLDQIKQRSGGTGDLLAWGRHSEWVNEVRTTKFSGSFFFFLTSLAASKSILLESLSLTLSLTPSQVLESWPRWSEIHMATNFSCGPKSLHVYGTFSIYEVPWPLTYTPSIQKNTASVQDLS